ncbi:MAG: FapA family protein [Sulfurospirillaceae bacterium]|nr:FapA family protein [Sulfurospirillaceae bacterium]MDD3463078.1 FapA family protein [Sulfurospirillaceae bacterium]
MGLFDKLKGKDSSEQTEEKPEFKSVIIDTENVPRELNNFALANNINIAELSFKLIKVTTSYLDESGEWVELGDQDKPRFADTAFMLAPTMKLKQHYRVEILKKETLLDGNTIPAISISANKSLTKVIVTIHKNLEVKYFSKLEQSIIDEIISRLIKAGVLIGVRDENLYKEIAKVVSIIRVNNSLEQEHTFIAVQGFEEVPSINDNLIFHYKKKMKKEDEYGRVDYAKRGYIMAVAKGECIIEYIKPMMGTPGRNCKGVFIPVKEPKILNATEIVFTENISKKEDDASIKYVANKDGYVNFDGKVYDIQDNMEISEVSFKSTGSIETGLDSNVKINITEKDALKDAIGAGMSVETAQIHVEGNVGSGARIKAREAQIGGQTHKTSYVEAETLSITVHRGEAVGRNVTIDRLEGGKVTGENITIKQMIGGELIGDKIKIGELSSNGKITASELIEIEALKGSNNKFVIDPKVAREFSEKMSEVNEKISAIEKELKFIPKQLGAKKEIIEKNKPTLNFIKSKIEELKQDGQNPPSTLMAKVRDFQQKVAEYNTMLQMFKNKKEELDSYKNDLNEVQTKIFSAKIINRSTWREFNEIRFKLISPDIEIVYNTKEHEIAREITLKQNADERYEIIRSSGFTQK